MYNDRIVIMFGKRSFVERLKETCEDNDIQTSEWHFVVLKRTSERTKTITKWQKEDKKK